MEMRVHCYGWDRPGRSRTGGCAAAVRSRIGQSTEAAASAAMPRVQRDGIEKSGAADVIGCSLADLGTGNACYRSHIGT